MFDLHQPLWNEGYRNPLYFTEGMQVWIPLPRTAEHKAEGKTYAAKTQVVLAAGNAARVLSIKHNILQWVTLEDCAITLEEYNKQLLSNRMFVNA